MTRIKQLLVYQVIAHRKNGNAFRNPGSVVIDEIQSRDIWEPNREKAHAFLHDVRSKLGLLHESPTSDSWRKAMQDHWRGEKVDPEIKRAIDLHWLDDVIDDPDFGLLAARKGPVPTSTWRMP